MSKKIICFGDSNTFGYSGDPSEKKGRFSKEARWTGRLQALLGEEFFVAEEGMNGRSIGQESPSALEELPQILEKQQGDFLLIMLGSNDCQFRFSTTVEEIGQSMEKLLTLAKESLKGENILVVAPVSMGKGVEKGNFSMLMDESSRLRSLELSATFRTIAQKEGCHFFNGDVSSLQETGINSVDFLHLNEKGHGILGELLATEIQKHFSES